MIFMLNEILACGNWCLAEGTEKKIGSRNSFVLISKLF